MKKTLFIFALVFGLNSFSQTTDAELWTGLVIRSKITSDWSLKYRSQVRFNNNASTLKTYFNELGTTYEVYDKLKVGGSYRYSRKNRGNYFFGENRLSLNLRYSFKLAETGITFKQRARYQFSFDRLNAVNDLIFPETNSSLRLKLDLSYKKKGFKLIQPFLGYELFRSLKQSDFVGNGNASRLYLGANIDLPHRQEISLKYIFEREIKSQPSTGHIYVIQYNYSLPSKLIKSKKKEN